MANRPRKRLDAPALFEDLDLEDPKERETADEKPAIDQLVTRVSSRPKSWAMKWRPDEAITIDATDADRHPARTASVVAEETAGAEPTVEVDDEDDGVDDDHVHVTAEEPNVADARPPSEPVLTSRTWDAGFDAGGRHPQTPSASPQPEMTERLPVGATSMHSTPVARPRSAFARAGWPLAILLAVFWIGSGLLGPDRDPTRDAEPSTSATPGIETTILARPTEVESLEGERVEQEIQRWQRRHAVALERLDEMDEELVRSDEEMAALAAERDALRRRLDALEGTD